MRKLTTNLGEHDEPYQDIVISNSDRSICKLWQDDAPNMHEYNYEQIAYAKLFVASVDLLEAAQEFCRRVESGEIRSTRSYNMFKAAIEKAGVLT
jgi:hypothetical protein